MTGSLFEIEIKAQGWMGDYGPEPKTEVAAIDLCSHGAIRLTIGGEVITAGDEDAREYGISESALALLRTLEADHSPEQPVAERLLFHGCGTFLMMGCPIGVDWAVSHAAEVVRITDVVRYDTVDEFEAVRFYGLAVDVPEGEYRSQVVAFAQSAKQPFAGVTKNIADDYEQRMYDEFWQEYEARLARAERGS